MAEVNEGFARHLAGWSVGRAQVDDVGSEAVRTATLAALDAGTPVVSFVGHSSIGEWELTPILRWQDVASLTNSGLPNLVLQWGCWSSYYLHPTVRSTSGELVMAPDAGAVATVGATTLTYEESHQRLGELFFEQVDAGVDDRGRGAPRGQGTAPPGRAWARRRAQHDPAGRSGDAAAGGAGQLALREKGAGDRDDFVMLPREAPR